MQLWHYVTAPLRSDWIQEGYVVAESQSAAFGLLRKADIMVHADQIRRVLPAEIVDLTSWTEIINEPSGRPQPARLLDAELIFTLTAPAARWAEVLHPDIIIRTSP